MRFRNRLNQGCLLVAFLTSGVYAQQAYGPRVMEAQGQTLYGRVYVNFSLVKSTDAGATWRPIYLTEPGLPQPAPSPASNYFAIEDSDANILYFVSAAADGYFWKSTDAGATWRKSNTGIPADAPSPTFFRQRSIAGSALYLRIGNDLYKSADRGEHWIKQGALPATSKVLEISTSDPRKMYALDEPLTLFASDDEGKTWRTAGGVTGVQSGIDRAAGIGILHSNANVVFAAINPTGAYRSDDGGRTFTKLPAVDQASLGAFVKFDSTAQGPTYAQGITGYYVSRGNATSWIAHGATSGFGLVELTAVDRVNRNSIYGLNTPTVLGTATAVLRSSNAGDQFTAIASTIIPTLAKPSSMIRITLEEDAASSQPLNITLLENPGWIQPVTATISNASWLTLSSASGNTPLSASLIVKGAGLAPGIYNASIKIDAPQSMNKSVTVPVELTVLTRGALGPTYRVTTIAGNGTSTVTDTSGPALSMGIDFPRGIAVDSQNRAVFSGGNRIWRVSGTTMEAIAGTGALASTGDNGPAAQAAVALPESIAINAQDEIFFLELVNSKVRKIANGTATTYIDGSRIPASAGVLHAIDVEPSGSIAIASDRQLARFNGQSYVSLGALSTNVVSDTTAAGVAVGPNGDYFVSERTHDQILRITSAGVRTVYAGTGSAGFSGDGGPAPQAQLNDPGGLAFDSQGTLFVADEGNSRIRAITADGTIRTIAGTGIATFDGDGLTGNFASLNRPFDLALDRSGAIYVSDRFNRRIRKVVKETAPAPKPAALLHGASGSPKLSPGSLFSIYGDLLASVTKITKDLPWPRSMEGVSVVINGFPHRSTTSARPRLTGKFPTRRPLAQLL